MIKKTVIYKTDGSDQPALTEKEKAELEALANVADDDIDTSDIPPLDETFWKVAEQGAFYKPVKKQITVRVDADVLAWLKSEGRGYQTRMNTILRQAMMEKATKHTVDAN